MKRLKLILITLLISITTLYAQINFQTFEKENMVEIIPKGSKKTLIDYEYIDSCDIFAYSIGKYKVTQELYESVGGLNPSYLKGEKLSVEMVTWYDAVYFCNQLTKRTMGEENCCYTITDIERSGFNIISAKVIWDKTKKGYRLPTVAELVFAARGGLKDKYSEREYRKYLIHVDNSKLNNVVRNNIHNKEKEANVAGIYDLDNGYEWCWDSSEFLTFHKIVSSIYVSGDEACTDRFSYEYVPSRKFDFLGIRVCRSLSDEGSDKLELSQIVSPEKEYSIIYELNGGINASSNKNSYSENATVTLSAPSRSGYTFGGWYWDEVLNYPVAGNTFSNKKGSLKVYPKWLKQIDFASFESENMIPVGGQKPGSGILMSKYEVTQELYQAVTGTNPSYYKGEKLPVESVTWYDAVNFCNELTKITMGEENCCYTITIMDKNDYGNIAHAIVTWNYDKKGYRLPTKAEWEMAAGADRIGRSYYSDNIEKEAWYKGNSNHKTHDVGTKQPNEIGIYDMLGNVREFCWDRSNDFVDAYIYQKGGSFRSDIDTLKKYSSHLNSYLTKVDGRFREDGFRVCRSRAYSIIYELNGGTNASSNKDTYSENATVTLSAPSRSGYKFDGWYWDEELKNPVAGNTFSNKKDELTVYAKWIEQIDFASFESENMVEILSKGQKKTLTNFAKIKGDQNIYAYSIGKYEVTQSLYQKVMGINPSLHKGEKLPVERVTWYDAVYFCNQLTKRTMGEENCCYTITEIIKNNDGNITDAKVTWNDSKKGYRLPTEAEWEFSAHGGVKGGWDYKYSGSNNIRKVAWYYKNSKNSSHETGTKQANKAGLYDMSGNVSEWCWDIARDSSCRILRGGSYDKDDEWCTVFFVAMGNPSSKSKHLGFRICRGL